MVGNVPLQKKKKREMKMEVNASQNLIIINNS